MKLLPARLWTSALLVAALFTAVTVLRFSTDNIGDGYSLLYVLPIAAAALQFALPGGLLTAALAMSAVSIWSSLDDVGLSAAGLLTRGLTFFLLGGLVGYEILQRRRLLARVGELAHTDELTGLANRRTWNDELAREIARSRRTGQRFAIALLDLDHFKRFNDTQGHQAGDELLSAAAAAWRARVREIDTVSRYGGEEFALLLRDCPPTDATIAVSRVMQATPMAQTVSAGIAHWDGHESAEALTRRADAALYEAKRRGRDRYVVAEGEEERP